MTERWAPVVGFEARYEVSDLGRVRSLGSTHVFGRYRNIQCVKKPRLLKLRADRDGYPRAWLCRDGNELNAPVHRLVLAAFVREPVAGEECRHLDGDRSNAALTNLRWGSTRENLEDKIRHGTILSGERNPTAKLSVEKVQFIRSVSGRTTELAAQLGVHCSTVQRARYGVTWAR